MARHEQFMKLAINMAFRSKSKFRLGAILIRKNRVLSFGINDMKRSHPRQTVYFRNKDFTCGLHAEVHCCIGVSREDLEGSTMYVARVLKNGKPALAMPCEGCQRFLAAAGVREVFYSEDNVFKRLRIVPA